MRKILALILTLTMVLGLAVSAFAADTEYKIKVTNTSENIKMEGSTFTAYKLFDVTYVAHVHTDTCYPSTTVENDDGTTTTTYDTTADPICGKTEGTVYYDEPHSYSITEDSWFFINEDAKELIETYFTLTETTTTTSDGKKIYSVEVKEGTTFGETEAYVFSKAMGAIIDEAETKPTKAATATGTSSSESVELDVTSSGAGYYIVTGVAKSADGSDVTAAVALTTTQPTAEIKVKADGVTVDKEIDDGAEEEKLDDDDSKENTAAVGDKVPYVVSTNVPNMTGYTKYFFVINDTMTKGLTYNNDMKIVVTTTNEYAEYASGAYIRVLNPESGAAEFVKAEGVAEGQFDVYENKNGAYVKYGKITEAPFSYDPVTEGEGESAEIVGYTKTLAEGKDYTLTITPALPDNTTDGVDHNIEIVFKDFYNNFKSLAGANITLSYSATVNGHAVIGEVGNDNTVDITYSNNPNVTPEGDTDNPDKPGENDTDITGTTPPSKTTTYVTGIRLKKVDEDGNPLKDAKFEFVGENLNKLVETTTDYYREASEGETATHYLLKDGTYTTVAPTYDTIVDNVLTRGTWSKYVQTGWDAINPQSVELGTGDAAQTYTNVLVDPTPADTTDNPWKYAYIVDQVQTWTLEGATPNVKLTVETDVEGIITITGLNEGWYVLTETEAPDGYNKLASPIYLHIEPVTTTTGEGENAVTTITGWKVTQYAEDDLEITPATEEVVDEESGEIVTPAAPASYKVKEGKTGTVIDYDLEGNAWLNEIVIVNQSGTELPSTGGIGTTIFYIVGSLLAVGAGVVLVAKKRMGKVED